MEQLQTAIERLERDHVICFPTDTVFGMAARYDDPVGKNLIYHLKGRPDSFLLPLVCRDLDTIKTIAKVDHKTELLISTFCPGPLTCIIPTISGLPATIAVRIPDRPFILQLIKTVGPLWLTSANYHNEETRLRSDQIAEQFPMLYVVPGSSGAMPSTIIDMTTLKIVRQGAITKNQIEQVLGVKL